MPPLQSSRLTKGYTIALVATVLWSSTAVFIRFLTETYRLPPLVLAFWRDGIVALALLLVLAIFQPALLKFRRSNLRFFLFYGIVLALFNSTWTVSVYFNGAAVSTVLAYSSAAFTALLGWRLMGESLGPGKLFSVALSIAGCVLVSGAYDPAAWQVNPLGIAFGLVSGIMFAAYSLMGRRASHIGLHPATTLLYTFSFGAGFLFIFNVIASAAHVSMGGSLFWLGNQGFGWLILFILAVGPTIGGYGLYTVSLVYLPASVANLIATLEPAMTAVLAYFFLAERLTLVQIAGSILILMGVVFLRWFEKQA